MTQSNLPAQLSSFIGREHDLKEVQRLFSTARLVTLTGMGGSGKTRLAIQVAYLMNKAFPNGIWLVDLVPLREPSLVPQLVAQTLGLHPAADQPLMEALVSFIQSKKLLLILDNCEHLREACGQLAKDLLSQAPELAILTTSTIALAIVGETLYPVSGLAWPTDSAAKQDTLKSLMQYDAIRLFVERAHAISPNFTLTPENAGATVEICRRLDGLPLALELASARMNILTVQDITARLNDRFALLKSDQRSGLESHHHTLRATIDWSYALLPEDEKVLLRRLAVFEGGCTLDTIEAICAGDGIASEQILDGISSLVSKSLIVADTVSRTQARYHLLETIREYALEKLDEAGETAWLRDRHLDMFLARVEEASPKLGGTYQQLWLNWLEGEHDNLRAALAWSLESRLEDSRLEAGLRIASALVRFWEIRGYVQEGMTWFERLLAEADERIPAGVLVNALAFASFMAMFLGNAAATMAYGQKAVEIADSVSDENNPALILALAGLATGARMAGDYQTAFSLEERGIALLRKSPGQPFYLGMALLGYGGVAIELGYYDIAQASLEESLAIAREAGDSFRIAHALNSIGDLARCERKYTEAVSAYENSADLLREIGASHDLASILGNLGHTYLHLGNIKQGYILFTESMAIHQAQHNKPGMTECLIGFAAVAVLSDLPAAGARLLAAATAISGQPATSVYLATRMEVDQNYDLVRARLSSAEFQAEQATGRAMSLEQAVDYALNLPLQQEIAPTTKDTLDGLTRRERQIAGLIGQGKTNGEIAIELVLSKRTIETHVSHILSKLELSGRGQLMRWAIEQGLTRLPD